MPETPVFQGPETLPQRTQLNKAACTGFLGNNELEQSAGTPRPQIGPTCNRSSYRPGGLADLTFAVPATRRADDDGIAVPFNTNFAAGSNIYIVQIQSLSYHALALLKAGWRVRFVREICAEIDARQEQPSRKVWHDLLLDLN